MIYIGIWQWLTLSFSVRLMVMLIGNTPSFQMGNSSACKWISFLGGIWTASLDYQRVTKQKALQSNSYICNWLQNKKQQIQNSINMSSMVIMHTNDIQYIVYTSYAYPMYNSAIWLHQSPSQHHITQLSPQLHAATFPWDVLSRRPRLCAQSSRSLALPLHAAVDLGWHMVPLEYPTIIA